MVLWPVRQFQDVARDSSIILRFSIKPYQQPFKACIISYRPNPWIEQSHLLQPILEQRDTPSATRAPSHPSIKPWTTRYAPPPPSPSTLSLTLFLPEPRWLQIRRWRRSLRLSNQRRPPRTPPQTRPRNNRPGQRPLHFQKPRGKLRMSPLSDRTPKRRLLLGSHPRSQTSDKLS